MLFTFREAASLFLIYAFLGWCSEVVFAAATEGKFVNRGFLNGPVCPIYGFGVLAVLTCLLPIADNLLLLFAGSIIITSLIEFLAGLILEKIFHDKWWDYSDKPFHLKGGYVCLEFSLLWGLACLIVVKIVHPVVFGLVQIIPDNLSNALLILFYVVLLTDTVLTAIGAAKLPGRLKAIQAVEIRLKAISDGIGQNLTKPTLAMKEKNELLKKYEELLEKKNYVQKRLLKAFPHFQANKYKEIIEKIKNITKKK